MIPLLEYCLKVNAYLLLFAGLYALLLRRTTFLTLNRMYLIGTVVAAGVLPFLNVPGLAIPWPWLTAEPMYATATLAELKLVGTIPATTTRWPDWPVLAAMAYGLVALSLLVRLGWQVVSLLGQIRQWPAQRLNDHVLVTPGNSHIPTFSFLTYLVLNPADRQSDVIRQHELVHIRQHHTLDLLFFDIVQALFWLNPALLVYKRAIRQVHEFLADRDAVSVGNTPRDAYARSLVNYAFHVPTDTLTHSFGADRPTSPTLKQRIHMLYRQHSRPRALWAYALLVPLAAILLAMTNVPEAAAVQPQAASTIDVHGIVSISPDQPPVTNNVPDSSIQPNGSRSGEVFTVVEQNPVFPGGTTAMYRFLANNIRYPAEAAKQKVQGKVYVSFVVNTDGSIDRVNILKGIGSGCDEEAVRVVATMPKWRAGRQNGKPVAVKYNLPIQFSLGDKVGQTPVEDNLKLDPLHEKEEIRGIGKLSFTAHSITFDSLRIEYSKSPETNLLLKSELRDELGFSATEPIYYIDGVEMVTKEEIKKLDPGQILSIDVIKGKPGEKPGRGIVRITTKK